ncbi:MauE/DoxX family redox-associated membrane protein [Pelagicoccus sp. SDUM812003]|uniref:MauE/DoxX family redox-associated membrane protein n=1 Tax=Pelagicoccus sp. SDUM812003 TaxID=3041267 RepID=UPI00280F3084|nr:MauE/DoxX family redox-associated membrane protein [Pelagicoccus sp. SDUM812003]MDQ8202443.1 MauE/DoxX family redox-associated membrane protein [Pelagicoccus sp. SDUM812003]
MKRTVSQLLYLVVGALFGYAAVAKILDPEAFLSSLLTYELFPYALAVGLAWFAPMLELVVAVCLASGFLRRGASWLTGLMLILFIILVAQGRLRGLALDCGCFGANRLESAFDYAWKIAQNLLMLFALWAAVLLEDSARQRSRSSES